MSEARNSSSRRKDISNTSIKERELRLQYPSAFYNGIKNDPRKNNTEMHRSLLPGP
jgi:hypothetical protein